MTTITIRELQMRTGEIVREVGKSPGPVGITDRGKLIAVLAASHLCATPRHRTLLPEYAAFLAKAGTGDNVIEDLNTVRGDR